MPREQINHKPIVTKNEGTPNEIHEAMDATCVHVGWNRVGWVQVSLSLSQKALVDNANSYATSTAEASIYSEVLTRAEINKLIRTLRKARDQAYGTDA